MHSLYETAGNRETQSGSCSHLIPFLHPVEFIENLLQIGGGNTLTFVKNPETNRVRLPPALHANCCAGGRILCRVIEDIKEDLLKEHRIQLKHREVCCKLKLDMMPSENLVGAPQRTADDFSQIVRSGIRHDGTQFKLRHVEQVRNEAIEPLGLVDDGCQLDRPFRLR